MVAVAGSSGAALAHLLVSVWSPYSGSGGTEFDHRPAGSEWATAV